MTRSGSLLNRLNELAAITFVVWFTWPYFRVLFGEIIALVSLILWFITCDHYWLVRRWSRDMVFALIFFATFLPHFAAGTTYYGASESSFVIVRAFPLFFVGLYMNHYYMFYKKSYKTLANIALSAILCYAVGSIQTLLVLQRFPLAARILATANHPSKELYIRLGTGGFGYIYAGLFLSISVLFLLRRGFTSHRSIKTVILFTFLAMSLMIIKASYTISIIMFFVGLFFVMIPFRRKLLILLLLILSLLMILSNMIGVFLIRLAEILSGSEIASSKLEDLALWFLQQEGSVLTSYRLYLYEISFATFLANPLFGIYGPSPNPGLIGGHSGWFDLLAFYGLFTTIPFVLAIYFNFKKHYQFFKGSAYSKYLLTCQMLFVILAFINPILYIYEIGFMMFLILPSLPFLPYAFSKHSALKKSESGSI